MKRILYFFLPIIILTVVGYAKDSSAPTRANVALAEDILSKPASPVSPNLEPDADIKPDAILAIASSFAEQSRYADAIALADTIPIQSPYASRSEVMRQLWANLILERAEDKLEEGKEQQAMAIFKAVPKNSKAYKTAAHYLQRN